MDNEVDRNEEPTPPPPVVMDDDDDDNGCETTTMDRRLTKDCPADTYRSKSPRLMLQTLILSISFFLDDAAVAVQ